MVAPLVARDEPERGQHAGRRRHEHRAHPELLGERAGVQRPGAAERDEREVARVVAALDGDDAQRAQHLGVRRPRSTSRGSIPPSARCGRVAVELEPARRASPGSRPSSRFASVTVGSVAAAPVAGGPGLGAGALAARRGARRPRRARRSSRRRRRRCGCRPSAAGSGSPPTVRSVRPLGAAARDQADVGRRAAHVERDRVLDPRAPGDERRRRRRRRPAPRRGRAPDARPPRRSSRHRRTSA